MMLLRYWLSVCLVLSLVWLPARVVDAHEYGSAPQPQASPPEKELDHDHDHAKEQVEEKPLSCPELWALVTDARKVYKQSLLQCVQAFSKAAIAQLGKSTDDKQNQAIADLCDHLSADMQSVEQDKYISRFAGRHDFDIASLTEAQKVYVEVLDKADKVYADALAAALRRDDKGCIGNRVFRDVKHCIDIELMCQLMEYYWHRGDLETPPGSFERNIQLAYRVVELEPQSPEIYTNAAWLLWSRWVSWTQDPKKMPVGEGDDVAAINFLLKGRKANMDNAAYHLDAAMTVWGLARYHKPQYFDFIIESLKLAEKCKANDWLRTRCRMTLGHAYRQVKKFDLARKAYKSVLEIDPDNEIAKRILKEMDEADQKPQT